MRGRRALAAGAWLLAAAVTVALVTGALDALGAGILGPSSPTLTAGDVTRALAAGTPTASSPWATSPSPSPSPAQPPTPGASTKYPPSVPGPPADTGATTRAASSPGASTVLNTPGGTVVARCVGGTAEVLSWSPAQGYRSGARHGADRGASVTFAGGRGTVVVTVTCVNGTPTASTATG